MAHAIKTVKEMIAVAKLAVQGVGSPRQYDNIIQIEADSSVHGWSLFEKDFRYSPLTIQSINPHSELLAPTFSIIQLKADICKRASSEDIIQQIANLPQHNEVTQLEQDVFSTHFDSFEDQLRIIYDLHRRLGELSNDIPRLWVSSSAP